MSALGVNVANDATELMSRRYKAALEILNANINLLAKLANALFEEEALDEKRLTELLECVSKIPEYAISASFAPFLRHKARLSTAKPSDFFLELTKNPIEPSDCPA